MNFRTNLVQVEVWSELGPILETSPNLVVEVVESCAKLFSKPERLPLNLSKTFHSVLTIFWIAFGKLKRSFSQNWWMFSKVTFKFDESHSVFGNSLAQFSTTFTTKFGKSSRPDSDLRKLPYFFPTKYDLIKCF